MFKLAFVFIFVLVLAIGLWRGPRAALWACWPAGLLLLPVWLADSIRTIRIDLRSEIAVLILILFLFRPVAPKLPRLLLADLILVLLILSMMITQSLYDELRLTTPIEFFRVWFLPYLMGRLFLRDPNQIREALPKIAYAIVAISCYAVVEAVIQVNLVQRIVGITFWHELEGATQRLGLKRAEGLTEHPLFLAMLLITFVPWVIEAYRLARRGEGPWWWRHLPWIVTAGICATVSRSGVLGIGVLAIVYLFFRLPWLRWLLAGTVLASGVLGWAYQDELLRTLTRTVESESNLEARAMVNGEWVEYSGVLHRKLLYEVYGDTLDRMGWFGYGVQYTKRIPVHPETDARFRSIDSHFVSFPIEYGWLGLSLYVVLMLTATAYLAGIAWQTDQPMAPLAAGLCGAILAVNLMLNTVFLKEDFGAGLLFMVGLAAGMYRLQRSELRPTEEAAPEPVGGLRDLGGHRPWGMGRA